MSGKHFVFEQFNSLGEYIDIIGKRKVNDVFRGEQLHSENKNRYGFFLTNNYEESVELALNGYKEGCDDLMRTSTRIRHRENIDRKMPTVGITGFAPHVPNAITGVPKSMISYIVYPQKANVITLVYANTGMAYVDAERYISAGKTIISLINTLETQGYRIALYLFKCSCSDNDEIAANLVKIKDWKQPINILKLAYPLIHPSSQRRQGFKWLETVPALTDDSFVDGYGSTFHDINYFGSYERRVAFLCEKGVLKNNWFYIERPQAEENDVDGLISLLGIDVAGKRKVA